MPNEFIHDSKQDVRRAGQEVLLDVYKQLSLTVTRADNCELLTNDNRKILDLYGGHAVMPLGYGDTDFLSSVQEQMTNLLFQSNLLPLDIRVQAAENLLKIAPSSLSKVFFVNSGSEANENALKIACMYTKRKKILAVTGAFHGRSAAASAVTWNAKKSWYGFPRLPFDVDFIPRDDLNAARDMINDEVAAVIVEPIQGVAGAYDLSHEFVMALRKGCDKVSAILIVDEVQTGMGRSGNYFAIQNYNIEPDILTMAKSLGGGVPCAALMINQKYSSNLKMGDLGSTFGGGPIACAAINAVIKSIKKNNLLLNVKDLEIKIRETCQVGPIQRIQGKGFLLGLICDRPAHEIQSKLLKKDILTGTSAEKNILRLLPPLVLQTNHVNRLSEALASIK